MPMAFSWVRCTTPFADQEIRYTTDGSEPTMRSAVYAGPLALDRSSLIRARVFTGKQCMAHGREILPRAPRDRSTQPRCMRSTAPTIRHMRPVGRWH